MILLKIGYQMYVSNEKFSEELFNFFNGLQPVREEYINSKTFYCPTEDEIDFSMKILSEDRVRELTKQEKENKEIGDLKFSLKIKDNDIKEKNEKIEMLECKLKLLETNEGENQ